MPLAVVNFLETGQYVLLGSFELRYWMINPGPCRGNCYSWWVLNMASVL